MDDVRYMLDLFTRMASNFLYFLDCLRISVPKTILKDCFRFSLSLAVFKNYFQTFFIPKSSHDLVSDACSMLVQDILEDQDKTSVKEVRVRG